MLSEYYAITEVHIIRIHKLTNKRTQMKRWNFTTALLRNKRKMIVTPLGDSIPIDIMKEVFLLSADEIEAKSLN